MKNINYKMINILLVLLIVYILYLLRDLWGGVFYKVLSVLKPFIVAFVIAYALHPFVKWLESKRVPKGLSVIIIVILLLLFIALIIKSLIPIFTDQLGSLFNNIMAFIGEMGNKYDINIAPIESNVSEIYNKLSADLSKYISDGAITFVNASISFFSNLIIIFVSTIYFLLDMDKIRDNVEGFVKSKNKNTFKLVEEVDYETTQYFRGLFLTLLIQFFEYTIIFKLIGHPNFLLLGILSSISTLIPYFGGLIVNIIALIIASVVSPRLFILTLIVSLILPNIDGYVISPKVYGKTNNISPLLSIFAVFAGGVLDGFVGILIALPVTIILRAIYKHYKNDISKTINNYKGKRGGKHGKRINNN